MDPERTPRPRGSVHRASRATSNTAASSTVSARAESQAVPADIVGRSISDSKAIAGGELISVRPCAPARAIPRASSPTSGVVAGNLAKTGDDDMRATASTTSAARSACAPRTGARASRRAPRAAPRWRSSRACPAGTLDEPDELLERAAGDRDDDGCAGTNVAGQLLLDERLDTRVLDPGRPRDAGRRFRRSWGWGSPLEGGA